MTALFRRRMLTATLIIAVFTVLVTGCGIEEVEVRNETDTAILARTLISCNSFSQQLLSRYTWSVLLPAQRQRVSTLSGTGGPGSDNSSNCLVIAKTDLSRWNVVPLDRLAIYEVREGQRDLEVAVVGRLEDRSDDQVEIGGVTLGPIGGWLLGVFLLILASPGIYFTVQFFHRFYVLKQR